MWFNLYLMMNMIHANADTVGPSVNGWGTEVISYEMTCRGIKAGESVSSNNARFFYQDNDECLQRSEGWGSYTCASATRGNDLIWCDEWSKDMRRCCPETCGTGVLTPEACEELGGSGECTYAYFDNGYDNGAQKCYHKATTLVNHGGSGCSPASPCGQCQGDCDTDADCQNGLFCFQRDSSSQGVPNCVKGGDGDIPETIIATIPLDISI